MKLWAVLLLAVASAFSAAQTFVVNCKGPDSGLVTEELAYDIEVTTFQPGGLHNIEYGAFIRTSPTPNGWDQVTATSDWGSGGWTGFGDVTYTTFFLNAGQTVHIHVTVTTDPGFKGDLNVQAYAKLSGGYTVTNTKTTKIGDLKVRLYDSNSGSLLDTPEFEPSTLRVNPAPINYPIVLKRCKVKVTAPTKPNAWIRAYIVGDAVSGGHDIVNHPHTGTRPHGWLTAISANPTEVVTGKLASPGTTNYSSYDSATVYRKKLDAQGYAEFQYVAPELSGAETLFVAVEETNPYTVPQPLTVRISFLSGLVANDDLELFSAHPENERHTDHYFGEADTLEAIRALAKNWRAEKNLTLKVNDISLPWGGLFDIAGSWTYSHIAHRYGKEFDVGGEVLPTNPTFERVLKEQGWWAFINESNHYHLDRKGVGQPFIVVKSYATRWEDQPNRLLAVDLTFQNRGGLPTVDNRVTSAVPDNPNVIVTSGVDHLFGGIDIRTKSAPTEKTETILMTVPANVSKFNLAVQGMSTMADRPETPFSGDIPPGGEPGTGTHTFNLPISTGAPVLSKITLSASNIGAGASVTGRVWLTGPATSNVTVHLSSENTGAANPTASTVVIPAGQASADFYVKTNIVPPTSVKIDAVTTGLPVKAILNLLVAPQSISFSANPKVGQPITVFFTFTANVPGSATARVTLPQGFFSTPNGTFALNTGGTNGATLIRTATTAGTTTVTCFLNQASVSQSVTIAP